MKQRTLQQSMTLTGVGLHSGERVRLSLFPAEEDSGICFCRTDVDATRLIRIHPNLINDTRLSSTVVTEDGVRIGTIEHLMSAFAALGIDNVLVQLNAPEIPIMDGSSLPFIYALQENGIVDQSADKKFLRILREVHVEEPGKSVALLPYEGFIVDLAIDFDHPVFNRSNQHLVIDFSSSSYLKEIARARTFGFMQEVELMRTHQLGLGGNLNNAIVVDETDVLNPEGLRYPDEFIRHKILDAVGDLYVLGHPVIGKFCGYKSGHAINNALLRRLMCDPSNYEWVSFPDNKRLPDAFHALPTRA